MNMKKLAGVLLVACFGMGACAPAFASTKKMTVQTRADRKMQKKQAKAMKKYLKAQKKAQQKMIKKDRKNTHLPTHY
jgi:3-hydroxy-3-methylglutaryl CoA synthase